MSDQATDLGSKFFVLGTYVQGVEMMDTWKARGINTLVQAPDGHDINAWSQAASSKGLYMIRQPSSNLTADANNPYLLAWATTDEPSNTTSTLDYGVVSQDPVEIQQQAASWRDAAAAAGKDIPIWTNHVGGHIYPEWAPNVPIMKDYMEGPESDWLASDSYPIQNGQPLLTTATDNGETYVSTQQGVNAFRQELWSGGKATMTFIGSSAYDPGQPVPTAGELKAQAWSGIINGAEGIIYFPVQLSPWAFDATPPHLQTAMKELHAEIKGIEDILMNEQNGGRAEYKVFHSAVQGATPTANQLPYGFEAAEIKTEDGGTYHIILNITGQERTLNKPEWGLNNVTFAAYGVQKGMADGSQVPTQPETPTEPTTTDPVVTDPAPPPSTDGSTILLRVSSDQYQGAAQFSVSVDGKVVATNLVASGSHSAGEWVDVKVIGDFAPNPKQVAVTFTNDLWGGSLSADRNLYVDYIEVNGTRFEGEAVSQKTGDVGIVSSAIVLKSSGDTITFNTDVIPPTSAPIDSVVTDPVTSPTEAPTFSGSDFTGTNEAETIIGNDFDNRIIGGGGSDVIKGGPGNDHINGGSGADQLWGGTGDDRFFFSSVNETKGDEIVDFAKGDIIDLSAIDARSRSTTNDAFQFIGPDAFTGAGQLRVKQDVANGVTYIEGNINRDPAADFVITVKGLHAFTAADFHL